jgi:TonB family protein
MSVGAHGAGFVVVLFAPTPRAPQWRAPDSIAVNLVASLPRSRPAPPAPPAVSAPPEEVVEVKPLQKTEPEKPPPKPAPARTIRKDAPRRPPEPSLEERIRRRFAEVSPEAPTSEAPLEEAKAAPPGPAAGTGAAGVEIQAIDFPYAWYLNVIVTRITDAWDPPGEMLLSGRSNQVVLAFRVFRDGRVGEIRVTGASSTPGLEASARRAVERAQPFPPLPDAFHGESVEVPMRFTVGGSS